MKILKILLILFILIPNQLSAKIIIDFEIESFLYNLISKIENSNENLNSLQILVLYDNNQNAFVTEDKLFINIGLLKFIDSPEGLLGVLAHELGHIKLDHIKKRKRAINDAKSLNQITSLVAISSLILTDNPSTIIESSISSSALSSNLLTKFSKDQEREADYFAIKKLNEKKINLNGLVSFLEQLKENSYLKGYNKEMSWLYSHPDYDERLDLIVSNKNDNSELLDKKIYNDFMFIKAKLFGYTEDNFDYFENYLNGKNLLYAKSIFFSRNGKLLESLEHINFLIKESPNNAFFLETKADILFNHGYTEQALKFYKSSVKINHNNRYVKKRIFEIDVKEDNFKNLDIDELIKNNIYLLDFFDNDKYFLESWLLLFERSNKDDWKKYIKAKKLILENNKSLSIEILRKLKDKSLDNQLNILVNKDLEKYL